MTTAEREEQKIEAIVERKPLEFLGDPDAGLELRPSFVKELKRRLKSKQKYIPHAEVMRRYGLHCWGVAALRDLGSLDPAVAQRVVAKASWLASHFASRQFHDRYVPVAIFTTGTFMTHRRYESRKSEEDTRTFTSQDYTLATTRMT